MTSCPSLTPEKLFDLILAYGVAIIAAVALLAIAAAIARTIYDGITGQ